MKTKLKSSRIKKRKNRLVFEAENIEIFEKSFIQYKKSRVMVSIQKKSYVQIKSNIIVSENFNLVYFDNDYFQDIERYLTNHCS